MFVIHSEKGNEFGLGGTCWWLSPRRTRDKGGGRAVLVSIAKRIRNKGYGVGWRFSWKYVPFLGGRAGSSVRPGWQPGGQVWKSSRWLQIPVLSLASWSLTSEGFLNHNMGVITAPRPRHLKYKCTW